MKKFLLLLALIASMSFSGNPDSAFKRTDLKKDFVQIKDDLFVSKFEATNSDYRNFLSDLSDKGKPEIYKLCLPDTLVWKENTNSAAPFVEYYFRHPSYDNYPVVGIKYEAAEEYCKWLTENYNQDTKRKYKKVIFKLLNSNEWTFAANKGDTAKVYTWGSGFITNNRKQYLCNFKHTTFIFDSLTKKYNEFPDSSWNALNAKAFTASVDSYYPNSFGLYNMCGNVAEMIEEKGLAKGGGFNDPAYKVRIASVKSYTKPQADIGFRVAMKIIEN